jgi:hypothetical protein
MTRERQITEVFDHFASEIPGFVAASLVDLASGATIATRSSREDFDLGVASAYNSELVRQKAKIVEALNLRDAVEDTIITLGDQIHFIRLLTPTTFVYLAADRAGCNLAIVRSIVTRFGKTIAA